VFVGMCVGKKEGSGVGNMDGACVASVHAWKKVRTPSTTLEVFISPRSRPCGFLAVVAWDVLNEKGRSSVKMNVLWQNSLFGSVQYSS
jgi:hypothetical protein